jgi:hypothetical protein
LRLESHVEHPEKIQFEFPLTCSIQSSSLNFAPRGKL